MMDDIKRLLLEDYETNLRQLSRIMVLVEQLLRQMWIMLKNSIGAPIGGDLSQVVAAACEAKQYP